MSKTLDIIMSLKDNVSPRLGKMNSNLQVTSGKLNAVGKSVGKLGSLLKGALVGGAIAKFSMDAIKAYDTQIQSEKSVQRALIATGKTAEQASQELGEYKKFASQQQDITAFGDEGTLQVISGLISQGFGKKSIEDIVAMSQDIARSTGEGQDNVTKALSAYVKTGKGATKLAKAYKLNADLLGKGKTESERMAEVWKAFSQSNHLGASTEYMKTFEGQLTGVKGRLDDLKEPVGQLINTLLGGNDKGLTGAAGAMASLQESIVNLTGDLQGIADRSNELGGGITGVGLACAYAHPLITALFVATIGGKAVSAVTSLMDSLRPLGSAITAIGAFCTSAIGGVVALTSAVGALVGAFDYLIYKMSSYLQSSAQVRNEMNATDNPFLAGGPVPGGSYDLSNSIGGAKQGPSAANGTNYFTGGRLLVGEYGPELVDLPRGSSVKTNAQTQRELSGNGYTINCPVTVQGNVIGNDSFIDQVGDAISGRVTLALSNM
jgi:hypothetical protein